MKLEIILTADDLKILVRNELERRLGEITIDPAEVKTPPNRHSVFCDTCLRGVSRPLFYPDARPAKRPFTRLLYATVAVTTVWLIVKTAEYVSA